MAATVIQMALPGRWTLSPQVVTSLRDAIGHNNSPSLESYMRSTALLLQMQGRYPADAYNMHHVDLPG